MPATTASYCIDGSQGSLYLCEVYPLLEQPLLNGLICGIIGSLLEMELHLLHQLCVAIGMILPAGNVQRLCNQQCSSMT